MTSPSGDFLRGLGQRVTAFHAALCFSGNAAVAEREQDLFEELSGIFVRWATVEIWISCLGRTWTRKPISTKARTAYSPFFERRMPIYSTKSIDFASSCKAGRDLSHDFRLTGHPVTDTLQAGVHLVQTHFRGGFPLLVAPGLDAVSAARRARSRSCIANCGAQKVGR